MICHLINQQHIRQSNDRISRRVTCIVPDRFLRLPAAIPTKLSCVYLTIYREFSISNLTEHKWYFIQKTPQKSTFTAHSSAWPHWPHQTTGSSSSSDSRSPQNDYHNGIGLNQPRSSKIGSGLLTGRMGTFPTKPLTANGGRMECSLPRPSWSGHLCLLCFIFKLLILACQDFNGTIRLDYIYVFENVSGIFRIRF